jgi:PIN domain nuclease of toxin-antitoxin system
MHLLDTHVLLWVLSGDPRLSSRAREVYENADDLAFSQVSLWETGIKLGLGREDFELEEDWWRNIAETLVRQGVQRLDVEPRHCRIVATLPLHHRDPFDRMLLAQAIETGSRLVSADAKFDAYDVERLW